jgi:hypothetical protein
MSQKWSVDFSQIDNSKDWNRGSFNGMPIQKWKVFKRYIEELTKTENFPFASSEAYHLMSAKGGRQYVGNIRFEKDNYRAYVPIDLGKFTIIITEAGDKKYIVNAVINQFRESYTLFVLLEYTKFNSLKDYFDTQYRISGEVDLYTQQLSDLGVDVKPIVSEVLSSISSLL